MGRRTLLVIASVLVAAVGTALIWVYVSGADARARRRWQEPVGVYVATRPIAAGATRDTVAASVERRDIPVLLAPDQRITSLEAIGSRATSVPVLAGQYLVEGQFVAVNAASAVPDDRMGVTVEMGDPNRVAGLLRPDSRVAVYAVTTAATGRTTVRNLLPEIRVIAVGATTTLRDADGDRARVGTQASVSTALVSLDADEAQAGQLMAYQGRLYFTLLGKGAKGSPGFSTTTTDAAPAPGRE